MTYRGHSGDRGLQERCLRAAFTAVLTLCMKGAACCVCVCACVRLCVFGSLTLQWQGPYGPRCETEDISLPYSLIHEQGRRAEATP